MRADRLLVLALSPVLFSCATPGDHVIFVTKTSLGFDLESTPPSASLAYDRVEGFIGPRFEDGSMPTVAGSFSTNGKLLDRRVRQVYATGEAAKAVTQQVSGQQSQPAEEKYGTPHKVMFFGTATVFGVKLAFGAGGLPESFSLGYKRRELSVIPIGASGLPSVLATIDTDVDAKSKDETSLGIEQMFATGNAAVHLANVEKVRRTFRQRTEDALEAYRIDESEQGQLAIETLYCLSKLSDDRLAKVWNNAETLHLFDASDVPTRLKATAPKDARTLYTQHLGALRPRSKEVTGLMRGHRAYVCELASQ